MKAEAEVKVKRSTANWIKAKAKELKKAAEAARKELPPVTNGFQRAAGYLGRKTGFAFKTGEKGLGYYVNTVPTPKEQGSTAKEDESWVQPQAEANMDATDTCVTSARRARGADQKTVGAEGRRGSGSRKEPYRQEHHWPQS